MSWSLFPVYEPTSREWEHRRSVHQSVVFVALVSVSFASIAGWALASRGEETVKVEVAAPSLDVYRELAARAGGADALTCPCARRSIARGAFARLDLEPNPWQAPVSRYLACRDDDRCFAQTKSLPLSVNGWNFTMGPFKVVNLMAALALFSESVTVVEQHVREQLDAAPFTDAEMLSEAALAARVADQDTLNRNLLIGGTRREYLVLSILKLAAPTLTTDALDAGPRNAGGEWPVQLMNVDCVYQPSLCDPFMLVQRLTYADINAIITASFANVTLGELLLVPAYRAEPESVQAFLDRRNFFSTALSFESYFAQCAPATCSFFESRPRPLADVVVQLFGLFGGLLAVCRGAVLALFWLPCVDARYLRLRNREAGERLLSDSTAELFPVDRLAGK